MMNVAFGRDAAEHFYARNLASTNAEYASTRADV